MKAADAHFYRRHLIVSLAIIGVSMLVGAGASYWFANDIEARAAKVVADRELIRRRSELLETVAELKQVSVEAEEYETRMDTLLPLRDELLDFSDWLENTARTRKLTAVFSFEGSPVEPTDAAPGYATFALTVEGAYADILSFIEALEGTDRFIVDFTTLDMQRVGAGYSTIMNGRVFFK